MTLALLNLWRIDLHNCSPKDHSLQHMKVPVKSPVISIPYSLIAAACSLVLIGCSPPSGSATDAAVASSSAAKTTPAAQPEVVIDRSSPDAAVKSWWRVLDLQEKIAYDDCNDPATGEPSEIAPYYPKILDGVMLQSKTPRATSCILDSYNREIQEVKTESETRAVVFTKIWNTSPIPPGVEPDKYDLQYRADGARFKYLVEKGAEGWKLAQVYRFEDAWKILETEPWQKIYTPPKGIYPGLVFTH